MGGDAAGFGAIRLLVVEDHAYQRGLIVTMARALGVHNIVEAANGREALTLLEGGAPADVVLCDLEMPVMDGVEFLREVAQRRLVRSVIISSGHESDILRGVESMVRASGLAVLGRVGKPLQIERLHELLVAALHPSLTEDSGVHVVVSAARLQHAIESREICALFQPKVRLADGAFSGAEVLARWRPTGATMVAPSIFVPAMVREGLITPLTGLMLDEACAALSAWAQAGLRPTVAVNVSVDTLADLATADRFAAAVARHGVDPRQITLELTETEFIADVARVLNVLTRLRLKGFSVSIDDFGTGHSSLAQLTTIPVNEIKIDQTFVRGCGGSERRRHIVRSSIDLARHLRLRTVGEGVETQDEWNQLAALGCDEAQGFLIARPMPASQIPVWAARWRDEWARHRPSPGGAPG